MSTHQERLPYHPRLGRNIVHDSRSLAYALPVVPKTAILSQHWERRAPIFDQGQVGSCTGNAAAGWMSYDRVGGLRGWTETPDGKQIDEQLALEIYSAAEDLDGDGPYPPNDNGSSGLSVAKVLKAHGWSSGYQHAFSIDAVYSALQTGPGLCGINWYNSMFDTQPNGEIDVNLNSGLAGGHEFVLSRLEVDASGAVQRVWMDNSWGTSWGEGGSAFFTPADLIALLKRQGDFTAPAPIVTAPPAPTPQPSPAADPLSFLDPVVADRIRHASKGYVTKWMNHHFQSYFMIR